MRNGTMITCECADLVKVDDMQSRSDDIAKRIMRLDWQRPKNMILLSDQHQSMQSQHGRTLVRHAGQLLRPVSSHLSTQPWWNACLQVRTRSSSSEL